ncbi:MAG: type IV toxin-antitoxin system AbiEi family antitoxin domain-containing protein [Acidimicrobiia bacterium]
MFQPIFDLASTQHGLITRAQLRDLGFERHRVARWVKSGKLQALDVNVLAVGGSKSTPERDLMAAVLETGHDASASHTTAAALWGLGGYRLTPIHVVVTRVSRHHHRLGWNVHQFTGLIANHQTRIDSIPVTSPALTMLHLASMVSGKRLARAVDNAWNLGLLTGRDLADLDAELARKGRDGIVALRKVAEERGDDWVPPQSNIESRFMELIRSRTGLDFRRQVTIADEAWAARVDFVHDRSRTIVEIQSERYHTALTDVAADRVRHSRLRDQGYAVVEVWDNELFQASEAVVERVRAAATRVA